MLIKTADTKTSDLVILKSLLNHPAANAETKRRIEQEIRNISSGAKGEADVAYELDFHYGQAKNWALIHDLRIEHKGRVAQIDHLLINRFLDMWVCESKRFSEGIAINEQGECAMFYQGKATGIGSPYEQNAKHIAVLKAACDDGVVNLPKRMGFAIKPAFNSLVVVSKNARISRPQVKGWWNDGIVKADQIKARIEKSFESDNNPLTIAKVISPETLDSFAHGLATVHVPATFDWYAKFGLSRDAASTATVKPVSAEPLIVRTTPPSQVSIEPAPTQESKKPARTCHTCGAPVEYKVVTFCIRFNKARFGGNVYCQDCQKAIPKPA